MDKTKYKSGSQKRKLKLQNSEKINKLPKINDYFTNRLQNPHNSKESLRDENPEIVTREYHHIQTSISEETQSNTECLGLEEPNDCNATEISLTETQSNFDYLKSASWNVAEISTDLGFYKHKEITDADRRLIINSQPLNKPREPFPKDPKQGNRSFSENYYSSFTQYGVVPRTWLSYSTILDSAYCVPCWLFSTSTNQWRTGVRDWQHISSRITEHSSTQIHIQSCNVFELWKKTKLLIKS